MTKEQFNKAKEQIANLACQQAMLAQEQARLEGGLLGTTVSWMSRKHGKHSAVIILNPRPGIVTVACITNGRRHLDDSPL